MKQYTVFYAGQMHMEFEWPIQFHHWRRSQITEDREIYNGAIVYEHTEREWWGMDMMPILERNVPKRLRLLVLINA